MCVHQPDMAVISLVAGPAKRDGENISLTSVSRGKTVRCVCGCPSHSERQHMSQIISYDTSRRPTSTHTYSRVIPLLCVARAAHSHSLSRSRSKLSRSLALCVRGARCPPCLGGPAARARSLARRKGGLVRRPSPSSPCHRASHSLRHGNLAQPISQRPRLSSSLSGCHSRRYKIARGGRLRARGPPLQESHAGETRRTDRTSCVAPTTRTH